MYVVALVAQVAILFLTFLGVSYMAYWAVHSNSFVLSFPVYLTAGLVIMVAGFGLSIGMWVWVSLEGR